MLLPALQILAIFVLYTLTNAQERQDVTLWEFGSIDVLPYSTVTGEPIETAANGLSTMFQVGYTKADSTTTSTVIGDVMVSASGWFISWKEKPTPASIKGLSIPISSSLISGPATITTTVTFTDSASMSFSVSTYTSTSIRSEEFPFLSTTLLLTSVYVTTFTSRDALDDMMSATSSADSPVPENLEIAHCFFTSGLAGECEYVELIGTGQLITGTVLGSGRPYVVVVSTTSSSSPSNTGTSTASHSIIIGSTVGTLAVIGGLLAFSFRYSKRFNGRKAKAPNTTPVAYDLKVAVPTNEEIELSLESSSRHPSNQVVLEYAPPAERDARNTTNRISESMSILTQRQMMLQERAGSIREEINAIILGIATPTIGEETVVVQHRIIQELRERLRVLEGSLSSDWARELTDEPPPQYSEVFHPINT